jgi:glycosyltransferase involved in cell wall biosynthesis
MNLNYNYDLSVVIPVYNEEDSIEPLYEELHEVLEDLGRSYEVIVIDDGSKDLSFARLSAVHERDPRWRVVRFRRNFGQSAAMAAGFDYASGAVVVTIDADLQNDPHDIPKLLSKLEEGYDIVSGWRKDRKEPFFSRRLPSQTANWIISRVTGVNLHDYGCTLKAYRTEVVKSMNESAELMGELHRFIPAIASSIGVIVTEVPVHDRARRFGRSKYGIGRTFRVILDLITISFFLNYSTHPLHVIGGLGLLSMFSGTLLGLYLAYLRLVVGQDIGNRPALLLAVLLVVIGVQLLSMGLVAEMVVRAYRAPSHKPIYTVREYLGDERQDAEEHAR